MKDYEELKRGVLALPPEQRIALAEKMLLSLGPVYYEAVNAAWLAEVEDRIRAYDEGRMKSYSLDESKRLVAQRLRRPRAEDNAGPK